MGNSVELKNVVLFDGVQTPHYNYVGDSILGYKAHMGAGSITSNVKSDKSPSGKKRDGAHPHPPQEIRSRFGRLRGGGLQQRPEPRHHSRPERDHISRLQRPRRRAGKQHL